MHYEGNNKIVFLVLSYVLHMVNECMFDALLLALIEEDEFYLFWHLPKSFELKFA